MYVLEALGGCGGMSMLWQAALGALWLVITTM